MSWLLCTTLPLFNILFCSQVCASTILVYCYGKPFWCCCCCCFFMLTMQSDLAGIINPGMTWLDCGGRGHTSFFKCSNLNASYYVLFSLYHFHLMRNWTFLPFFTLLASSILLISHSYLSLTITSGAESLCWPSSGSFDAFLSRLRWNMLWIFIKVGSFNWHDDPTNALILNRLTILWSNFFDSCSVLIFFVDNHTLSLTLYSTIFRCQSMVFAWISWVWAILAQTNFYTFSMLVAIDLVLVLASHSCVDSSDKSTESKLILEKYLRIA